MTSSTSSSSSRRSLAWAAALALAAVACGHGRREVRPPPPTEELASDGSPEPRADSLRARIAILPVENLTGETAPTKELLLSIEMALARRLEVVSGEIVKEFMARHRIRYTGGLDGEAARTARDELGVGAVLITSLEAYRPGSPPRFAVSMRLISTGGRPTILWMDGDSRSGDEAPGLLALGIVSELKVLQDRIVARLTSSLASYLEGRESVVETCGSSGRFAPKVRFRSRRLDGGDRRSVAVLPFLNVSKRRGAGERVALEFVRQLADSGSFRVLEPGVVRDLLLRFRIIIPSGVTLESARLIYGALEVDLVLAGIVFDYDDGGGPVAPKIRFAATMIDGHDGRLVWSSSSYSSGDDGVWFFGLGQVATSGDLTCRMVAGVVDRMESGRAPPRPRGGEPSSRAASIKAAGERPLATAEPRQR